MESISKNRETINKLNRIGTEEKKKKNKKNQKQVKKNRIQTRNKMIIGLTTEGTTESQNENTRKKNRAVKHE